MLGFIVVLLAGPSVEAACRAPRAIRTASTATISFGPRSLPQHIAAADLNADGSIDLAVAGWASPFRHKKSNAVTVLLARGSGRFGEPSSTPTSSQSEIMNHPIAIGDLNGDRDPDIAVASAFSGKVAVLLNDGRGGFLPRVELFVAGTLASAAIAESKLIVTSWSENRLYFLTASSTGALSVQSSFEIGDSPRDLIAADFDGDRKIDLATLVEAGERVIVYWGPAFKRTSRAAVDAYNGQFAGAGDLNGDRRIDLAVIGPERDSADLVLVQADRKLRKRIVKLGPMDEDEGAAGRESAVGDFNGDGCLDLATVSRWYDRYFITYGLGAGRFSKPLQSSGSGTASEVFAVDLDDDGKSELLALDLSEGTARMLKF